MFKEPTTEVDEEDIVFRLRKRAEIRAKIDRGDGKPDRISVQLLEAAEEIENLRYSRERARKFANARGQLISECARLIPMVGPLPDRIRFLLRRVSRFRQELRLIACYGDESASKHLEVTGSYGAFDEPGSVQYARELLDKEQ